MRSDVALVQVGVASTAASLANGEHRCQREPLEVSADTTGFYELIRNWTFCPRLRPRLDTPEARPPPAGRLQHGRPIFRFICFCLRKHEVTDI